MNGRLLHKTCCQNILLVLYICNCSSYIRFRSHVASTNKNMCVFENIIKLGKILSCLFDRRTKDVLANAGLWQISVPT